MGLYLIECFKKASIFAKLAFIFLLLGMFTGWIAFCTDNWGRAYPSSAATAYSMVGYGVWRGDTDSEPPTLSAVQAWKFDGWLLEWYGAFQAFATFGFILLNVGFLLMVLFMFVTYCKCNADLAFRNGIINIFGSICWFVAVVVFGAMFDKKFDAIADANFKKERQLHYSFGFAVITFLVQLVAGICLLLANHGKK